MGGNDTSVERGLEVVPVPAVAGPLVVPPRTSPEGAPGPRVPRRLRLLLAAGCVDSIGYAFGWTVWLLLVTDRHGVAAAAAQTAAMLVGVALAAPFSALLTPRVSPRAALRLLAAGEAVGRLSLFVLLLGGAPVGVMAAVNVATAAVAWSGFAAMRAEVALAGDGGARTGRHLTWYAAAVGAVEALAAAGASFLLAATPPAPVVALVAAAYVASLVPQWLAGAAASADPVPRPPSGQRLRAVLPLGVVGAATFVLAAGPALFAVVLAYDLYGPRGVAVAAVSFAAGAMLAARFQTVLARVPVTAAAACGAGAVMVGGWSLAGLGLAGLAVAQVLAGGAQHALEGELDRRIVGRLPRGAGTAGLAFASSSMALGGALAVTGLTAALDVASVGMLAGTAAAALLAAALLIAGTARLAGRFRTPRP